MNRREGGGEGEDSWDGPQGEENSGSPRNMDLILEQAKENHRNGVISDGEYSTIIRQVFQMSESKMIREVERREMTPQPHDHDLRPFPHAPPHPNRPMWAGNEPPMGPGMRDPRRPMGGPPGFNQPFGGGVGGGGGVGIGAGAGRHVRFGPDVPPVSRPNAAFEVRPEEQIKTINIDNIPREIRFYGDKAVILMAADDPRELGFQPATRLVFVDNVTVECAIGNDYVDFNFDGHLHRMKLGAPTRELYIDGQWYECMFGGPPISILIGNRHVPVALEGPPPTVKIGNDRRLDLLAGRVTMIIDAHSVVPVYLDLKVQHFELEDKVYTLQFKDSLRTVVIDTFPYRVDYGGLPMAIQLDNRKHFVRFSALPRGVEPGRVLQNVPVKGVNENLRPDDDRQFASVDRQPTSMATAPVLQPASSGMDAASSQVDISQLLSKLIATGLLPGNAPADNDATNNKPPKEEVKQDRVKGKRN